MLTPRGALTKALGLVAVAATPLFDQLLLSIGDVLIGPATHPPPESSRSRRIRELKQWSRILCGDSYPPIKSV